MSVIRVSIMMLIIFISRLCLQTSKRTVYEFVGRRKVSGSCYRHRLSFIYHIVFYMNYNIGRY